MRNKNENNVGIQNTCVPVCSIWWCSQQWRWFLVSIKCNLNKLLLLHYTTHTHECVDVCVGVCSYVLSYEWRMINGEESKKKNNHVFFSKLLQVSLSISHIHTFAPTHVCVCVHKLHTCLNQRWQLCATKHTGHATYPNTNDSLKIPHDFCVSFRFYPDLPDMKSKIQARVVRFLWWYAIQFLLCSPFCYCCCSRILIWK